jgi:hypothetical protein
MPVRAPHPPDVGDDKMLPVAPAALPDVDPDPAQDRCHATKKLAELGGSLWPHPAQHGIWIDDMPQMLV